MPALLNIDQFAVPADESIPPWLRVVAIVITSLSALEFSIYTLLFLAFLAHSFATARSFLRRTWVLVGSLLFLLLRLPFVVVHLYNYKIVFPQLDFGVLTEPEVLTVCFWAISWLYFAITALPPVGLFVKELVAAIYCCFSPREGAILDPNSPRKPTVVAIVPVYNELSEVLLSACISFVESQYPKDRLHLILAFDDKSIDSPLFKRTMKNLNVHGHHQTDDPDVYNLCFSNVPVTLCRFQHAGKRQTQARAFALLETYHKTEIDQGSPPLVLLMDSDVVLDRRAVASMVSRMSARPSLKALCGLINCTSPYFNLWLYLQDAEYVESQWLLRGWESMLGGVTCLPGAFTMLRYEVVKELAPSYFGLIPTAYMSHLEYPRLHLGEDRFMTFLVLEQFTGMHQVAFEPRARCKTYAPSKFTDLLRQRRRWFLGTIANEAYILTSPVLWASYPLLLTIQLLHSSYRSLSMLNYLLVIFLFLSQMNLFPPLYFVVCYLIPLGLTALSMLYMAVRLRRWNVVVYPITYVLFPFVNWIVLFYSIATFTRRSWGGPRVVKAAETSESPSPTESEFDAREIIEMYSDEYQRWVVSMPPPPHAAPEVITVLDTESPRYIDHEHRKSSMSDVSGKTLALVRAEQDTPSMPVPMPVPLSTPMSLPEQPRSSADPQQQPDEKTLHRFNMSGSD
ncbi:chitin synthase-domain-containing protein [Polychytrium aggregatum]|uniref:chitin synthase-domain-containing protein n=1 Tax=Polychytrium aggregatum TaxID=110093 RepID=UPI0022FEA3AD|nr:chitin synthase-domain-containing protein [Polychytrium aggregatum]KAI9208697.1 chitin synthase-domain-containing protein [Polychytrium aggregatum]